MKWGLRWELCIIIVFIICLLVATFGLNRFGLLSSDSEEYIRYVGEEEGDTFSYSELEKEVSQAGTRYYKSRYSGGLSESVNVDVNTLIGAGYLSTLYDGKGRRCTGYAHLSMTGSSFGYIKCRRYKSEGYDPQYE
jgi:hypothetical protein